MVEVAQAQASGLMPIGAVAAQNIAALLNLDPKHAGTIERAIKDEINIMSSHFTMAIADVQTQYEIQIAKIKAEFTYTEANRGRVALVLGSALVAGFFAGLAVGLFA